MMDKIFITGGAGYVGSVLTPYLLNKGYHVTVLDLFMYGNTLFPHPNLKIIKGDIRDKALLEKNLKDIDTVIHLACISNDPSFELNPNLGKSINLDAFPELVSISKFNKIKKFIYASSSSVYGIKSEPNVNEEMSLEPLTDYSKFKVDCEKILNESKTNEFQVVTIRPATVCGFSPRQRLDVVVNILTNLAFFKKEITVFGGEQLRSNIHILDMVRSYEHLLKTDFSKINGEIFNVGFENDSVENLANTVKEVLGGDIAIKKTPTNDNRSYHISSEKIKRILNFEPKFSIRAAVVDLKNAFKDEILTNTFDDIKYYNIKVMNNINLK
jgi:nucleoside-diphosphate-sugar epimerase